LKFSPLFNKASALEMQFSAAVEVEIKSPEVRSNRSETPKSNCNLFAVCRPAWIPNHIPELDGLRGLAILLVVLYHCHEKLNGTPLSIFAKWGWVGVNLFFVLSGFLITGIVLDSRRKSPSTRQFFRDFYVRRTLRIWPVYLLVLFLVYVGLPFLFGVPWLIQAKTAPWLYYALLVQNLFMISLPGTLGPTWSLGIEEQYYLLWAPLARLFPPLGLLILLLGVIVASPFLRILLAGVVSRTHTLIHLDGIALGSLLAVALHTIPLLQSTWRKIGPFFIVLGGGGIFYTYRNFSAALDTAVAMLFAGLLLAAISFSGDRGLYTSIWKLRWLRFYGRVSYGLYMTHILTFVVLGNFDRFMERYGIGGNLTIVFVRLLLSTAVAASIWYGFEKPILRWKSNLR
jgi:peptidoglycan/LPS O-acetylase OafA/YrhL